MFQELQYTYNYERSFNTVLDVLITRTPKNVAGSWSKICFSVHESFVVGSRQHFPVPRLWRANYRLSNGGRVMEGFFDGLLSQSNSSCQAVQTNADHQVLNNRQKRRRLYAFCMEPYLNTFQFSDGQQRACLCEIWLKLLIQWPADDTLSSGGFFGQIESTRVPKNCNGTVPAGVACKQISAATKDGTGNVGDDTRDAHARDTNATVFAAVISAARRPL